MNNKITGHVELQYPSKYVKSADLRGRDVTVTIVGGEWETLVMMGGKKDRKIALTLSTPSGRPMEKKWVVGKTVLRQIAAATGETDVSKWGGKSVTLYPTTCPGREKGTTLECVRVRVRTVATDEPTSEMMASVETSDTDGGAA